MLFGEEPHAAILVFCAEKSLKKGWATRRRQLRRTMSMVSLHLPGLRTSRLSGHPHPRSVADLYLEIEELLENLHARPASSAELRNDALSLKGRLMEMVDSLAMELSPQDAREHTLAALTGGMFSGVLDGALMFSQGERPVQPDTESKHAYLVKSSRLLWQNLERVLETGDASWREAHIDDLQLLSGYGRHENRHSLDEGEALERQTRGDRSQFQAFLLASFKGGYAMGVVDAAVMFVGGERPGAPPTKQD